MTTKQLQIWQQIVRKINMVESVRHVFSLTLIVLGAAVALLVLPMESGAQPGCPFEFTKVADGEVGLEFEFQTTVGNESNIGAIPSGVTIDGSLQFGTAVMIIELPRPGWELVSFDCVAGPGVTVEEIEDGVILECVNPEDEQGVVCTVTNVRVALDIPTLSEWGMITAAAGLGFVGVFFAVRRRRALILK